MLRAGAYFNNGSDSGGRKYGSVLNPSRLATRQELLFMMKTLRLTLRTCSNCLEIIGSYDPAQQGIVLKHFDIIMKDLVA